MFRCALLCLQSSFANILMGRREPIYLLFLSTICLLIVVWLFLAVPLVGLQFVIVVFPDQTHSLFYCFFIYSSHLLNLQTIFKMYAILFRTTDYQIQFKCACAKTRLVVQKCTRMFHVHGLIFFLQNHAHIRNLERLPDECMRTEMSKFYVTLWITIQFWLP